MRAYLQAHEIDVPRVWVVDRFRSSPEPERAPSLPTQGVAGFRADLNLVRDGFARFDVLDERVRFVQGAADALDGAGPREDLPAPDRADGGRGHGRGAEPPSTTGSPTVA